MLMRLMKGNAYEIRKSRAWILTAAVAVTLAGVLTAALIATTTGPDAVADIGTAFGQGEVLIDPITGLILCAMAAAYWGSRHRDGSVLWQHLSNAPGRRSRARVFLAALVITTTACVLAAALAMLVKVAVLTATLAPAGTPLQWWNDSHGWVAIGGSIFAAAFLGALGTSVAFIARDAALAVGGLFVWLLIVEPITANLLPAAFAAYLPGQAMATVRNAIGENGYTQPLLVATCAVAAISIATWAMALRRDPA